MKKKVCMIVQNQMVKGGIAAVVNGYRGSRLEKDYEIIYVESYMDGGKFTKFLKGICGYFHFAKVVLIDRPDLVHIHSSFGPSFYRKIPFVYMAFWAKIPILNHIHGADFEEFYINASSKKKRLVKKIYGKCSSVVALSEEWKKRISSIIASDKIRVIENYSILCEDALDERIKRECNNTVLFLGEIGRRKGCYDIPEVVAKVVQVIPTVKFVLCGAGSMDDENNIKTLLEQKRLSDYVLFPGWVRDKDKDSILRKADLFFLPSYNEGMPMSILDAMGYGLPVISTNVGGIPKIVRDGENGECCEPGDVNGFARAIIELLENRERRVSCAKESVSIVKNGYSLEIHLALLEDTYESLLQ